MIKRFEGWWGKKKKVEKNIEEEETNPLSKNRDDSGKEYTSRTNGYRKGGAN